MGAVKRYIHKFIFQIVFFVIGGFFISSNCNLQAQTTSPDSTTVASEELALSDSNDVESDTLQTTKKSESKNFSIDAEITYNASDSMIVVTDSTRKVYLYRDAIIHYKDIEISAYYIEIDMDKNECFAKGTVDSTGQPTALPVLTEDGTPYEMRTLRYNFKTKKAIIEHVVTQQGEGYVVSEKAKKSADNSYCLKDGHYSTCDNHEHQHYYINLSKAKVIPGKKTITGPAWLVIEDVPIYVLFLPFGYVPSTSSYSSGIIMPSYGEESSRGLFLRDGGYYWAASDYFDLAITGDIYANKSWGVQVASKYKKRYKYGGSFNIRSITNINSEKELDDYSKSKDFSVNWSHRQDSKANPLQTLSASVNFSTSSYDRNNVTSIINPEKLATNTKRSSISYSRRFPDSPFNFSANILGSQNTRDSSVTITLPDMTVTMNRIFPFKSKNKIGSKEAWYEKISLSYSGTAKNSVSSIKESELFPLDFSENWKNGAKHSIPVSMNLKFLKYFTLSPSINYTERWYFNSISKEYDKASNSVINSDTTSGFNRVYDYSFSAGTSTKLYTYFRPWKKLFGDKINTIRHVMTPSASLSYRPDFSDEKYGYYDYIEYYDEDDAETVRQEYSRYEGAIYGTPGSGKSGSLSLSVGNTLEMKVKSDKDTTGFKKIKLLESLNLSSSHNFMADSMKW